MIYRRTQQCISRLNTGSKRVALRRWLMTCANSFDSYINERDANPSAGILDGRTLQSTPESGERAAHDGYKR